jgi:2-polyprenyl-3-methyl-5-hydroxy-6-metoxy-1,4-benzoquinol methylase
MNYLQVYTDAFSQPQYSAQDHVQYHYVTDLLDKLALPSFKVIDVGSGRGQLIQRIRQRHPSAHITSVDLRRFHDEPVDEFIRCDLSNAADRERIAGTYSILTCTDVLEHLDKSYVDEVLARFSKLAGLSVLAIANHSDVINGVELHTIQEDHHWWEERLGRHFEILDRQHMYAGRLYMYVVAPLKPVIANAH